MDISDCDGNEQVMEEATARGGEAGPEAMRLHITNSCLFALDPSPGCTS